MLVMNEEEWNILFIWAAEIFVEIIVWTNRDPVFGLVFAWAAIAVIVETIDERPQY